MKQDEKRAPAAAGAFTRARATLERARSKGVEQLRRTGTRVAEALGSAAGRLKETSAGERLGATLETRRVIKRAAQAQARGNAPMAYRLLEAEIRQRPGEPRLAAAFWQAAVACQRPQDAAGALLAVIRKLAASDPAEAARLWSELALALPHVRADAGSLVRLVPSLLERDATQAVQALQHALDPQAAGLTPGLAVRIAEYARVLDPPTALRAARVALQAPDLHEARRQALAELVTELERDIRKPSPGPPEDLSELAVDPIVEALAPATRFSGLKVTDSVPFALGEEGLDLRVGEGRRGRLEYAKIQAVALARVPDLAPRGVVIDLALNWLEAGGGPLRVVRMRSADFEGADLVGGGAGSDDGLRAFLGQLLQRSDAVPLPDREALLGDPPRAFRSAADYQRDVLQAESEDRAPGAEAGSEVPSA